MSDNNGLWVVVMAKPPVAGKVKTRLIGDLTAQQACWVHRALLECVMSRLSRILKQVTGDSVRFGLALDGGPSVWPGGDPHEPWELLDQGGGDLGQRLATVWQHIGKGPVMFFGVDSPDVPESDLLNMVSILQRTDAGVGPVSDGGYWMLGANQFNDALLKGIDWGTANVYHQTIRAAREAQIDLASGTPWYDVDTMDDLVALRKRINGTQDADLITLGAQLSEIYPTGIILPAL